MLRTKIRSPETFCKANNTIFKRMRKSKDGKSIAYTSGRECHRKADLLSSSHLQRTDFRDYIKSEFYRSDNLSLNVVFLWALIKEEWFLDDKKFANKSPVSYMASGCGGTLAIFIAPRFITNNFCLLSCPMRI